MQYWRLLHFYQSSLGTKEIGMHQITCSLGEVSVLTDQTSLLGSNGNLYLACNLGYISSYIHGVSLTPHLGKSEAILISRKDPIGPTSPILIGGHTIKCVIKTRLMGMTVDHKLSWVPHTLELKKSFVNKLCLLKKLRFLPRKMLQDFYLRVIFPSGNYGLILWGACCN